MEPRPIPRSHAIYTIGVIGFIYTLHLVIPMYSASSFLSLFADESTLSLIYMTGAAVTVLGFLVTPPLIRKMGNYSMTLWLVLIQIGLFYGLVTTTSSIKVAILFILQTAVVSMIALTLDIFLEVYTDSTNIGSVRGLYMATLNVSWIIAPLIGSMLVTSANNYHNTYVAGLAMLIPLFYLIYRNFPRFKDPHYTHPSPWQLIKHVVRNKNWVELFSANLILQTFYAWMVVYSIIYLNKTIGFGWDDIGIILVVMLLPFSIIQYPLGRLADKRYGEREIMALGFFVMGAATIFLAFITSHIVLVWAIALFMTRVGAAAAEIMIETYLFKTTSSKDAAALGVFRISRPLAYFTAPLVTIFGLMLTDQRGLFIVLGIICFCALIPVLMIKDTK